MRRMVLTLVAVFAAVLAIPSPASAKSVVCAADAGRYGPSGYLIRVRARFPPPPGIVDQEQVRSVITPQWVAYITKAYPEMARSDPHCHIIDEDGPFRVYPEEKVVQWTPKTQAATTSELSSADQPWKVNGVITPGNASCPSRDRYPNGAPRSCTVSFSRTGRGTTLSLYSGDASGLSSSVVSCRNGASVSFHPHGGVKSCELASPVNVVMPTGAGARVRTCNTWFVLNENGKALECR